MKAKVDKVLIALKEPTPKETRFSRDYTCHPIMSPSE